ncbi:MAG: hypothetical protein PUF12_01575 [Thermoflexaceae bacterium]|nr:hypothetical protein [Thermoflexaceae bacterium]
MADRERESQIYLFDKTNMIEAYQAQLSITAHMETSFRLAMEIYNELETTDLWQGKSKEEFQAFFHLVMQFHGALINAQVPNGSELKITHNFCREAQEAFRECYRNMMDFPSVSEVLNYLGGIQ